MVEHDAVEGTVDAIIHIVHKRRLAIVCVYRSLAKHIDSESMGGACKVATYKHKDQQDINKTANSNQQDVISSHRMLSRLTGFSNDIQIGILGAAEMFPK